MQPLTGSVAAETHVDDVPCLRLARRAAAQTEKPHESAGTGSLAAARRGIRNGSRRVARDRRLLEAIETARDRGDVVAARLFIGVEGRAQRDDVAARPGDGCVEMVDRLAPRFPGFAARAQVLH